MSLSTRLSNRTQSKRGLKREKHRRAERLDGVRLPRIERAGEMRRSKLPRGPFKVLLAHSVSPFGGGFAIAPPLAEEADPNSVPGARRSQPRNYRLGRLAQRRIHALERRACNSKLAR